MSTDAEKAAVEVTSGEMPMAPRSAYGALAAADEAFRSGKVTGPRPTVAPPAAPAGFGAFRTAHLAPAVEGSPALSATADGPQPTARALPPGEVVLPPTRVAPTAPPAFPAPAPALGAVAPSPAPVAPVRTPDETLFDLVRLLHRLGEPRKWSPVERALVVGARAAFAELSADCAQMLDASPPDPSRKADPGPAPSVEPAGTAAARPKRASAAKAARKPKPVPEAKPGDPAGK